MVKVWASWLARVVFDPPWQFSARDLLLTKQRRNKNPKLQRSETGSTDGKNLVFECRKGGQG
jgi:hypothetical protein